MKKQLDAIRQKGPAQTPGRQAATVLCVILLGFCLGVFSKYLDFCQTSLPGLLQAIDDALDFHNFLGSFAPWLLLSLCIAVYSSSPLRAGVHVFGFLAAMISGYYLYCHFVAGFFPKGYAMIWAGFTLISPALACLCWYARGKGPAALVLSAAIVSVFINCAFAYGMLYISLISALQLAALLAALAVLRRPAKEMAAMLALAAVFAVVTNAALPFRIW